ncbi:MAG: flagellar basal body P-ring formation chaperone FlgA [Pseudomonadota bacterium]|nr:flagellar basal body P-ring formation chaperone FlgA [Pseudomonadota bacterium]
MSSLGGLAASVAVRAEAAFSGAEHIRQVAVAATGADPAMVEARIDPRVRMAVCRQPLVGAVMSARMVSVRCPDTPGWRLFVPVSVRRVSEVAVLAREVEAGQPIAAEDMRIERRESHASQPAQDAGTMVGGVAQRRLPAGAALNEGDLASGPPLKRGDPVVLVSRFAGAEIRMEGRAMGAAAQDGVVAVENVATRKIIRGRWRGGGVVEVVN